MSTYWGLKKSNRRFKAQEAIRDMYVYELIKKMRLATRKYMKRLCFPIIFEQKTPFQKPMNSTSLSFIKAYLKLTTSIYAVVANSLAPLMW